MESLNYNKNSHLTLTNHTFVVEKSFAGQRIDKFLTVVMPLYSRSFFQKMIDEGHISVNQHTAKASSIVHEADLITVNLPVEQKRPVYNPVNTDLGIEILHTHEHFFIINKPAHLLVHQTEVPTNEPTVVDWLLSNHHELIEVGSQERPGIVHRLDKETSGLMIIARTNFAHKIFGKLFKDRSISKTYVALVEGHPPQSGTIDLSIGRHPTMRKKMTTHVPDEQLRSLTTPYRIRNQSMIRNAITHYTVREYYKEHSLLELHPQTGRTHQIRVHCAAIGHPLVGDYLYGTPSKAIKRHALHASSLAFNFEGKDFLFEKELPVDFKTVIEMVGVIK